jgi:tRNA dimethylallyltransferase
MNIPLLVIGGPTGVGKTATAVALAQRIPVEVVSADSRQVYRGMDIATGKPVAAERQALVHHLIDVVDPDERYHAARFVAEARAAIVAIHGRGRLPAVVGGTGFYIRALLRGLDPAPPADPEFRRALSEAVAREGRRALYARLGREAPALARGLHPHDTVRVIRALERARTAGAAGPAPWRWTRGRVEGYDLVYVGLTVERAVLRQRLAERAREMVAAGLADEVRGLLARGYEAELPAMQGIGYRQFIPVVQGRLSPADALAAMQRETVRYARRQWTWFAREPEIQWCDLGLAGGAGGAAAIIERRLRERSLIR